MKDLASHIMDIVQNSIRACAGEIDITLMESQIQNTLTITIHDNGCGMTPETLAKVRDPFFTSRTVRKVGLGIPLLQQNAERTGGKLDITSTPGKGTTVTATFGYDHLDRPPLGNMAETLCLLIGANPETHFIYRHATDTASYSLDTAEIKEILGEVPINNPEILHGIREMIEENLRTL
ncbi:MAG TPA: ATP-binding protein [Candidatus Odoribacter faecigallinarum]|uniref:histidine kinase n=1 Tax=Candidatus Odoribacter faecigallinarum TaxID=2838706 RepID=A0A9D2AC39_9BACT|nr:ATP-binding protein [Candidatus Odoribacter faecigallinarum]